MLALLLNGAFDFCYEERPVPTCGRDELLVKIGAVCICGSDIHAIRGAQKLFTFPRVIGHEVGGTVVEVGADVPGFAVGDKVCLMPTIPCGHCRTCRNGQTNACHELKLYGVHADGGMQEFFTAPAAKWLKMPQEVCAEEIAMLEPLTIGAHAVAKLDIQQGDRVLIIGAGPIGMSCAVNVQTYGGVPTLSDMSAARRKMGQEKFGLAILDPSQYNYREELLRITDGEWFDAVIDTTAVKSCMETDWKWIRHGGKILFVGVCNGTLEIDGLSFHMREPSLYVTRNSTKEDFESVTAYWQKGVIRPKQFITHRIKFCQAAEILPKWVDPEAGVFKGVVLFDE